MGGDRGKGDVVETTFDRLTSHPATGVGAPGAAKKNGDKDKKKKGTDEGDGEEKDEGKGDDEEHEGQKKLFEF